MGKKCRSILITFEHFTKFVKIVSEKLRAEIRHEKNNNMEKGIKEKHKGYPLKTSAWKNFIKFINRYLCSINGNIDAIESKFGVQISKYVLFKESVKKRKT